MAAALDVARYLIQLAANEDEPDYLSHLRLQKLLYYVQGWSLGLVGRPMFPERIEAWMHGPVVVAVYPVYAGYGYNSIPIPQGEEIAPNLTDDEREFIDAVWQSYRGYSAVSLREMTHQEAPWVDARKGYGPAERCEVEITHAAMEAYFSSQAE